MAKGRRYQRGNQKQSIKEGQTIQWPKVDDTKGEIRNYQLKNDRQYNGKGSKYQRSNQRLSIKEGQTMQWPKVEDTKVVIRSYQLK